MKYISILLFFALFINIQSADLKPELKQKIRILASKMVKRMSIEERAGQLIHIGIPSTKVDKQTKNLIKQIKPGGVILFGINLGSKDQIKNLSRGLQLEAKKNKLPPLLISIDQEGGRVVRVQKSVTEFPGAMAIGQTGQKDYANQVGFITGYQLKRLGINFLLAPVLDINNNPSNPVINTRSFGSDLTTVSDFGLEYEKGVRESGNISVIKHFPGHGDTNVDSHTGLPIINKTEEQLMSLEIAPFKKAIDQGAKVVMSAHIIYPTLDKNYPATLSKPLLTDLLKKKLNYKGVVITDAMEMDAISKNFHKENTAKLAIHAGADIILLTSYGEKLSEYYQMILSSIKNGEFIINGEDQLERALINQIALKIESGLFHSETSAFIYKNRFLQEYIDLVNLESKQKYKEYLQIGLQKLNQKISYNAIRSYQKEFYPIPKEEFENTGFFLKNETFIKELSNSKLINQKTKNLKKDLSKKKFLSYVFETEKQEDLDRVTKYTKKYPKRSFIILHVGSPFLKLPNTSNVKIIFSFSPTVESKRALFRRAFKSSPIEPIPKANLIFLN